MQEKDTADEAERGLHESASPGRTEELLLEKGDKRHNHIEEAGEGGIYVCAMCGSNPCVSRCPNAPEPKAVHTCIKCKEGITDGEKYYDSPKGPVCEYCIEDMTVSEFMELIGEGFSTAELEE